MNRIVKPLIIVLCAVGIAWPNLLRAEGFFGIPEDAVGTAIVYGFSRLSISTPPDTLSNAEKGLIDVLPDSVDVVGPGFGVSFGDFGFLLGFNTFDAEIDRYADVSQTPTDSSDDVFVIAMQGESTTLTLLYQALDNFFLGYGRDRGRITFQVDPDAVAGGIQKFSFESDFYSLGYAFGFDPTKGKVAPILSFYFRTPADKGAVGSEVYGVPLGIFF